MTRNPIYISILRTVHDNISLYFKRYLIMATREMEENLADLRDVVAAVGRGDGETARRRLEAHVRRFNAYMERHPEAARPEADGGPPAHQEPEQE